ncbi:MAG: amidase [Methylocystis sp.]|nr:amidase [Methylocystis sp.]MCA3585467.1 amidase [Methylocystis sp.]MCA3588703.1 amidase [Methylocystis sp.]MCA3592480.1 amidase [Methylocystis sp.]
MPEFPEPWSNISDIAAAVTSGRSTATAETHEALFRIAAANGEINAFVHVDAADALRRAALVDQRIAAGESPALAGVPVAIKDNIWVKGRPITQGSLLFRDFIAPASAIAIDRLEAAGAVIIGIASTSEFACSGQTRSLLHGVTRNPLDPGRTPGGSSGGPVAAVASEMVPLAIGTDAGGSSRRPPAHTGLVGFKPSFGTVPYGPGFEEPTFGVSCICPIARTVGEAALAFEIMAGRDPRDPSSVDMQPNAARSLAALRIAAMPRWGFDVPVDPDVREATVRAFEALRQAGCSLTEKEFTWPSGAAESGLNPLQHAGLARLFGEEWRRDPTRIHPDLTVQIEAGLAFRSTDVAGALFLSEAIARAAAGFFIDEEIDLAIGPTTPCTAWPVDLLAPPTIDGMPVGPRGHAVFTPMFNHSRQPAITIPIGRDRDRLPIGLQIVAPRGQDRMLLSAATEMEALFAAA